MLLSCCNMTQVAQNYWKNVKLQWFQEQDKSPLCAHHESILGEKVQVNSFLTLALDRGQQSTSHITHFMPDIY
jgi:hypothetical protein